MPARPPSLPADLASVTVVQQGYLPAGPSSCAAASSSTAAPPTPLSFLLLSQNIGSIDCTGIKGELPAELCNVTQKFLASLGVFLQNASNAKFADDRREASNRQVRLQQQQQQQQKDAEAQDDEVVEECGSPVFRSRCAHFGDSVREATAGGPPSEDEQQQQQQPQEHKNNSSSNDEAMIDVVVWHLQEIGGKKYNESFNQYLASHVGKVLPKAAWCSGLLMQAQNCDTTFTAMGVVIFLSPRAAPLASILSVRHRTYVAVLDDPTTYTGNAGCLFLNGKFSNAEKSRKGYLLTSLRIANTCMNFVNLHLYHDADNATAAQCSPSKYTPRRVEAFLEAMSEVVPVLNIHDPLFIFGDLNTRLDGKQVVDYLTEHLAVNGVPASIEMGKKEIRAPESFWSFFMMRDNHRVLQQFDREPQMLLDRLAAAEEGLELCELPVHFPPTYMLDDTHGEGAYQDGRHLPPEAAAAGGTQSHTLGKKKLRQYKRERMPAWCDRILMNAAGLELITGTTSALAQEKWRTQNRVHHQQQQGGSGTAEKVDTHRNARCLYDSVSLEAMDHEAVFLLF